MAMPDRCDLRGSECACAPTHCAVQPQTAPAPVHRASVRDILFTSAFVGSLAFWVVFAVAYSQEGPLKKADLANQEQVATWK